MHSGEKKTYNRIANDWFWEGMKRQILRYVKGCETFQRQKSSMLTRAGLLQPLPIPNLVREHVSMDFIEGLPKVKGTDTVLVVVDSLTKYARFITLKHPFTTLMVASESSLRRLSDFMGSPPLLFRIEIKF